MTTIGFLGAGNIAQAILGGMLADGYEPGSVRAYDPAPVSRERLDQLGIGVSESADELVGEADVVMLCVKPDVLPDQLAGLSADVTGKLFISVAAGVTLSTMSAALGSDTAIIRCMPNTPALVQTGMTGLFASASVTDPQQAVATRILSAVGEVLWVESEAQLDAVTAVSGSGPAYFFLMMESMINAGIAEGLSAADAEKLVLQTALGAATMASRSEQTPGTLRQQVTSPGGTTQAAITHFESAGFENIVTGAVAAARKRSVELSGK